VAGDLNRRAEGFRKVPSAGEGHTTGTLDPESAPPLPPRKKLRRYLFLLLFLGVALYKNAGQRIDAPSRYIDEQAQHSGDRDIGYLRSRLP
jgi:hypothetical protein